MVAVLEENTQFFKENFVAGYNGNGWLQPIGEYSSASGYKYRIGVGLNVMVERSMGQINYP